MGRTGYSAAGGLLDALAEQVGDAWRRAEPRRPRLGGRARGHVALPDLLELLDEIELPRARSGRGHEARGPSWSMLLGLAAAVCAALGIALLWAERPARAAEAAQWEERA